jgi:2,3-dihydroxybiphenyl 1,2-dioxygenase
MTHDIELASVELEVADRPAFESFLEDVVGLVRGDTKHTWRNDAKAHRIVVDDGPRNDATRIAFEATSDGAYERAITRLGGATATAPWGTEVEIARALPDAAEPFSSRLMPGGFLTRDMGFGHVVFGVPDIDAAHAFATERLGMRQSDWLEMDTGGFTLNVRFYHCNPRHHTLALAAVPFELPTKLHHLMLETNDVDDVGAAFDRVWNAGLPIANGLGKHPNDEMFSFYVVTPAGFQMEIGHGARTVTEPWTENRAYDRISSWGHQPIAR